MGLRDRANRAITWFNNSQDRVFIFPLNLQHVFTFGAYRPYAGSRQLRYMLGPIWFEIRPKKRR